MNKSPILKFICDISLYIIDLFDKKVKNLITISYERSRQHSLSAKISLLIKKINQFPNI